MSFWTEGKKCPRTTSSYDLTKFYRVIQQDGSLQSTLSVRRTYLPKVT